MFRSAKARSADSGQRGLLCKWRTDCRPALAVPLAALVLIFWTLLAGLASAQQSTMPDFGGFNHAATGFELTGAHKTEQCAACHLGGRLEGTPRTCVGCHDNDRSPGKPESHPKSADSCTDCHTTENWIAFAFDHSMVSGSCVSCHDGSTAAGKPVDHSPTGDSCESCHITATWSAIRFDHSATAANCQSCHNGRIAEGKSPDHVPTGGTCDTCHVTTSWTSVRFDHASVTGACSTCHNGSTATGKPGNHFVTTQQCDDCHRTTGWTQVNYQHSSSAYPTGHSTALACTDCHRSNAANAAYTTPAYRPDCAGCHANDFKSGPHKKYEKPSTVFYRVDELRDCAGSCHMYTDASMTTIKKRRTGEHRASKREW